MEQKDCIKLKIIMGICSPGGQTNEHLTSSSTLDHQLMEFSTRHWCFAIMSTLVAVASLIKWKLVRTGFSHMSSRQYQE